MVDSIEGLMLVRSRRRASLGPARSAKGKAEGLPALHPKPVCVLPRPCACQKMHGCRRS
jgi:hypothetical protein